MPEYVEGPFTDPTRGDSEQRFSDRARAHRLARLEAQTEMLARELAECRAQLAAQAEAILDRAAGPAPPVSPRRRTSSPRRRGDTFLRVVKVGAAIAVCLTIALAALHPRHLRIQRYSPRCSVACARPVSNQDVDHDGDAR